MLIPELTRALKTTESESQMARMRACFFITAHAHQLSCTPLAPGFNISAVKQVKVSHEDPLLATSRAPFTSTTCERIAVFAARLH